MEHPEILVHISAPSSACNDAKYRAQVEAVLAFQGASRQRISTTNGSAHPSAPSLKGNTISGYEFPERVLEFKRDKYSPNELISLATHAATKEVLCARGYPLLHSAVPLSSTPNQTTPSGKGKSRQKQHDLSGTESFGTPVSVIPDSQPAEPILNLQCLDAQPLQLATENRGLLANALPAKQCQRSSPAPENRRYSRDTPPLLDTTSTRRLKSLSIRQCTNHSLCPTPANEDEKPDIRFSALPLIIRPPPPQASTNQFSTHVTPALEMLVNRLKPSRIFKPVFQTRDLNKLERGYWLLRINVPLSPAVPSSCGSQGEELQPNIWDYSFLSRVWTFLSSFITREDRAGWGTWCILESAAVPGLPTPGKMIHPVLQGAEPESTWAFMPLTLKIYSWGEIACHVYLLLFLASERLVKKMSMQWRDSRDDVVIQMP